MNSGSGLGVSGRESGGRNGMGLDGIGWDWMGFGMEWDGMGWDWIEAKGQNMETRVAVPPPPDGDTPARKVPHSAVRNTMQNNNTNQMIHPLCAQLQLSVITPESLFARSLHERRHGAASSQ